MIDHAEKAFLSTPSARRATWPCWRSVAARPISIHALREEGDGKESSSPQPSTDFYPRPPRGGRRASAAIGTSGKAYFYPRPPRGGRPPDGIQYNTETGISIHALREEGDPAISVTSFCISYFYPRPPRGGRRDPAAVEEVTPYFYPRPPRGGRQVLAWRGDTSEAFLSTPSARRATTNLAASVRTIS